MSVPHGWDSVTVLRATLVDSRGTKKRDWSNPTQATVKGCNFQYVSSVQNRDGRLLAVAEEIRLFAPFNADIQAGDRIQYDGNTYEVDGLPMARRSPSGHLNHLEIKLREWVG